jgi:hypothetical protein
VTCFVVWAVLGTFLLLIGLTFLLVTYVRPETPEEATARYCRAWADRMDLGGDHESADRLRCRAREIERGK